MEQPIAVGNEADGDDEDLDLERLHLVGEDLAEHLGVLVGERLGIDVVAAVGVALHVGVANTGDAELVVLVVATDAGERDAVVDLGDLAQVARRILGAEQDALVELDGDETPTSGDALLGVVGPILHHLFGCDVERHVHGSAPLGEFGDERCEAGGEVVIVETLDTPPR